jgi:hypothetical protein
MPNEYNGRVNATAFQRGPQYVDIVGKTVWRECIDGALSHSGPVVDEGPHTGRTNLGSNFRPNTRVVAETSFEYYSDRSGALLVNPYLITINVERTLRTRAGDGGLIYTG